MNHPSGLTNIQLLCLWTIQLINGLFSSSTPCTSCSLSATRHSVVRKPDGLRWFCGHPGEICWLLHAALHQVCLWHSPGVPPAHAHFLAQRRPRTIFISVQGLSPNHSSFRTSFCCCMLSWASSCWLFPPHSLVLEVPHHTSPRESWGTCLCLLGPQVVSSIPRPLSDSLGLPEPTHCGIRQRPVPTQRRGQGTLTKEKEITFLFDVSVCFSWRSSETIP